MILFAERDPYAAEFADYFLRTEGYTVRIVLDADEAGRILETDPPHLVVIDLMISGGAGLALCRDPASTVRSRSLRSRRWPPVMPPWNRVPTRSC